jgi:hypothetical protein
MDSRGAEDQTNQSNIDFTSLTSKIDDALMKLELYWNTGSHEYEYFGFREHFAPILKERDNSKFNLQLYGINIEKYWDVIHKINSYYISKEPVFLYDLFHSDEQFINDIKEICDLHDEHIKTTGPIYPYDEIGISRSEVSFLYLLNDRPIKIISASDGYYFLENEVLDWRAILLSALKEPGFSRVETWSIKQKKSEYSPLVFFRRLLSIWHHYNYEIKMASFAEEEEHNFEIECWCNYSAHLNNTVGGLITINKNYLKELYHNLQDLYNHFGLTEPGLIISKGIELKSQVEKTKKNPPDDSVVESLLTEYSEYFNTFELEPESPVSIEALSTTGVTFSATFKPLMHYSSFQGIFYNGFNFTKAQIPFLKPKVFCGSEIVKIEKWLSNIEDACNSSGLDIRDYKLSQEYLRLETYLEYLYTLRDSNQFDFLNSLKEDESETSDQRDESQILGIDGTDMPVSKTKTSFPEFFNHKHQEKLAIAIKNAFIKSTPTELALMIYTLRNEFEDPLLKIGGKDFSKFHKSMADFFEGENIGQRQHYLHMAKQYKDNVTFTNDISTCKEKINTILKSID